MAKKKKGSKYTGPDGSIFGSTRKKNPNWDYQSEYYFGAKQRGRKPTYKQMKALYEGQLKRGQKITESFLQKMAEAYERDKTALFNKIRELSSAPHDGKDAHDLYARLMELLDNPKTIRDSFGSPDILDAADVVTTDKIGRLTSGEYDLITEVFGLRL